MRIVQRIALHIVFIIVVSFSTHVTAESVKQRPFKGFAAFHSQFKSLCQGLEADGRLAKLLELAKAYSERDAMCESCRPLLKQFQTSCGSLVRTSKEKSSKKKKVEEPAEVVEEVSAEPTPTPTPLPYIIQREPSALVIDRIAQLFGKIAEDEAINIRSLPAIQKLIFILRDKNSVQPGAEAEYFDIFCEYVGAHFTGIIEEQAQKPAQASDEVPENKEKNLGDLFGE